MADDTDTTGGTGAHTGATGAAKDSATGSTGATETTAATTGATETTASAATIDTLLDGLRTVMQETAALALPGLSMDLWLPPGDGARCVLHLQMSPPAQAQTAGTGPKGGTIDDLVATVRTAIADGATVSETMVVEKGYQAIASLQPY